MNKLKDAFSDREFIKKLVKLTLPIAFQGLMLSLVAAADAFMLGNVEQNAMSAVSLATQIQFLQNMIVVTVVTAASILGAQYYGKNDRKTVEKVFGMALKFSVLVSFVFFIGCVIFPRYLMLIFTNEEVLIEIGIGYLKIAGWSYLMTGVSQVYLTMMKVSDHASMTAKVSTIAVILNIILNAVFIYGLLGAPRMGVKGAAVATLIARIVELLVSYTVSMKESYISLHIDSIISNDRLLLIDFWKCFIPLLGAMLLWAIGFTSYTAFMGHLGVDAAAGNSVASVVRDIICCLCNGLSSGGGILVGNELGAGNLERGKLYGDRVMILAFVCGLASCVIMFALTPLVLDFVKLSDEARRLLIGMMVIMAVYMIGRAVNTIIINGIFAAGGDTVFDVYSLAVTMWGIAIPLAALGTFAFHWPALIVYACTCLDEVGKIPWVMIHYKKYKWVKDLTRDELSN